MPNFLNLLPEELQTLIYQKYFNKYVLTNIDKKCFYTFTFGQKSSCVRCNSNTIYSAFCRPCHVQGTPVST